MRKFFSHFIFFIKFKGKSLTAGGRGDILQVKGERKYECSRISYTNTKGVPIESSGCIVICFSLVTFSHIEGGEERDSFKTFAKQA